MSQLPNKTPQSSSDAEPTLYDVLGAINTLSTDIDLRFDGVDARLGTLEGRVDKIELQMVTKEDFKQELQKMVTKDHLTTELAKMKVTMVTKDYLDAKLADQKGDLIVMMRKEDNKITRVVGLLEHKKIFTKQEAASI